MNEEIHHLTARLQRLYKLHAFGIKFGLEAEQALLKSLGNPQQGMKIIHVAGTNGKGSVCALAESILRAAGFKTGLYTSPHLMRVNERIKVNGEDIPDGELASLIELVDRHAKAYAQSKGGREITFFEFLTALSFEHFRRRGVEALVLETGMGGRLDATNVITPRVAVITSIGLEHTQYLGSTLAAIAAEKAGIIKNGAPVVVGDLPEEALQVIIAIAKEKNARVINAAREITICRREQTIAGQKIAVDSASASYGAMRLPLLGAHQLKNTAIALAALEEWFRLNGIELEPAAVKRGLAAVSWPGRFQVVSTDPVTIIDGAHNPEAAAILNEALEELFDRRPVYFILGMCSDKNVAGFIRNIKVPVRQCWVVGLATERSLPPADLAKQVKDRGWTCSIADLPRALAEARREALRNDGIVCAAGSFYLAGEILLQTQIHEHDGQDHTQDH